MDMMINIIKLMKNRDRFLILIYSVFLVFSMIKIISEGFTAGNILYFAAVSLIFIYETRRSGRSVLARQIKSKNEEVQA